MGNDEQEGEDRTHLRGMFVKHGSHNWEVRLSFNPNLSGESSLTLYALQERTSDRYNGYESKHFIVASLPPILLRQIVNLWI